MLEKSRGPGTRVAPKPGARLALLATSSWALMGCLVTEKVQIEVEPNYPPSIESADTAEHPLNQIIVFDLEEGVPGDLPLEVVVRDPNVGQELFYKIFVDGLDNANEVARGPIGAIRGVGSPSTEAGTPSGMDAGQALEDEVPGIHRRVDLLVQSGLEAPGCHRVELRVTSDFAFDLPANPRVDGDLATAVWWVFTKRNPLDSIDPSSCPKDP